MAVVVILSITLLSGLVAAQPVLPAFYYGDAAINGRDVPVDSVITARINGQDRGSITVTTAGQYGVPPLEGYGDAKLNVQGTIDEDGAEISYFLKAPGLEEIQATEKGAWHTNTLNEEPLEDYETTSPFDLTFNGDEVSDGSDIGTTGSSGGGGGGGGGSGSSGGGGGGGGGSPSTSASQAFFYDIIRGNEQVDSVVRNENIPVTRLQLIINDDTEQVTITIASEDDPDRDIDDAAGYFTIESDQINDDLIKTAIIRFEVPNEWFEENDFDPQTLKLHRLDGRRWVELQTVHSGGDDETNLYRAATPAFGLFGMQGAEAAETETTGTEEEEDDSSPLDGGMSAIAEVVVTEEGEPTPVGGALVIVIIVVVGLLAYIAGAKISARMSKKK